MPTRSAPGRRGLLGVGALIFGVSFLETSPLPAAEREGGELPVVDHACVDSVAGVWQARGYFPRQAAWYDFTITVARGTGPDALTGTIDATFWDGTPSNPAPQPCRPGYRHLMVRQPAAGSIHDSAFDLAATSWHVETKTCGSSGGYVLDHFVGTIDAARTELRAVNRYPSGGRMVEDPVVFRRVSCAGLEAPTPPGAGDSSSAARAGASATSPAPPPARRRACGLF